MKQFQYTKKHGLIMGPFTEETAKVRLSWRLVKQVMALHVGDTCLDEDGDTWERLPDLALQDDVPLALEDVTEPHESAVLVRSELRLERIATAALQGLLAGSTANVVLMSELNKSGIDPFPRLASYAHLAAKALIAELDKQS